jgi:hypothetical protein
MRGRRLVLLIALSTLSGCYENTRPANKCDNDQTAESLSPDKEWKAVLFLRQCGDGPTESHISVLPATATLQNEPGNAFRQDRSGEGSKSSHSFQARWKGPRELWIGYDSTMKPAYAASQVGPVKIFHSVGMVPEP